MLSPVDAEGESKSSSTVQLNQRAAAQTGCSPGGRQIKEGGHSAGGAGKRLDGLWRSWLSAVPRCDPDLAHSKVGPQSFGPSRTRLQKAPLWGRGGNCSQASSAVSGGRGWRLFCFLKVSGNDGRICCRTSTFTFRCKQQQWRSESDGTCCCIFQHSRCKCSDAH